MDSEQQKKLRCYIETIPKAELHVHVEGTLEPELMFKIAKRNNIVVQGTVESHKERRSKFKVCNIVGILWAYSFKSADFTAQVSWRGISYRLQCKRPLKKN